ncbi:MAG: diacylglycerol kinase family protein, partial [Candidatus Delongbacteria bacterium]|nr:diacylglycerol kinase family protein [Candidatus Delongbacteria bacterium]
MIYFVFNKTSGTYIEEREDIIRKRSKELFTHETIITYTKSSNDFYVPNIDPSMIKNNDIIVAVGGDGTINLCLQFVHDNKLSNKVALGFIPAGTGNNMVK